MARKKAAEDASSGDGIFKPKGDEFLLDLDFKSIADEHELEVDAIEWSVEDEERDGVIGHVLRGVPK